ncbi:7TM diverse intracellular signaling domain-containing protein [Neptunicella sp. SCSIO 80796]|uniref:hybrid sensor histidine kinase/response regulator n=1 Tax=Neptunicella plasticusilytica TaxID=3117012 RepID=UPI003A4E2F6F
MNSSWRLALLLLLCFAWPCAAQTTVQLINTQDTLRVTSNFKVLHENGAPLDISQIIELKDKFEWPVGNNQNFGFTRQGLWFHLHLSNVTKVNKWVVDIAYAQNDRVDFYLVRKDQVVEQIEQGKLAYQHQYRLPTMELDLPDASPVDLFIRVQSDSVSRIVPIDIQTKAHHTKMIMLDSLLWGLFYGALLILVIYNLVMYVERKEISSLAYVVYILSVMLWQFVWGGHIQMVFSGSLTRWLNLHTDLIFMVVGLSAAAFTLTFLNAKYTAPRSYRIICVVCMALVLLTLLSLINIFDQATQNTLVYIVSIVGITSYLIAGFESYAFPYLPARYFIFAWSILLTCALVGILGLLGILPSNEVTSYCFQAGVCCEAVLFSMAIMEKSRCEMENEIATYTREMRQNLELIEEKNAHLDIARKDAIRASQVKSQFLANMSHEIRTPLNAILGFSKELQSSVSDSDRKEHARIVNTAATNLLGIINDVLDFSKIEAGKLQVNNEPFSPEQLLDELIGLMAKTAQDKHLEFIFESEALPNKLIGDASRIRQVLTNLLGNAIKFTPQGHVKLKVCGRQEGNFMWLTFSVEDTGIGISTNQQKVLFKAFSQVDDALNREFQGTGLGLVISQQLTQLMHGQIKVESEISKGSYFTATIRTQILNDQGRVDERIQWRNKRIMLVEPYLPALHSLNALFVQMGAIIVEPTEQNPADFLFWGVAAVPDEQQIEQARAVNAVTKILLHPSGIKPMQHAHFNAVFNHYLEKPLSVSKLDKLFEAKPLSDGNQLDYLLNHLPEIKLLAVDDMEFNLRLLSTWLKPSPVQVSTSLSGQDAVSRCEKESYDLILMDLQMPNMDGLQASRLIRQTELNRGTPIIAVTAHVFKEEQERLLSSGMDDYLPKPVGLDTLVDVIQRWCQVPDQPVVQSVDWQLALQQSHSNQQLATQMLQDFLQQLPELQQQINQPAEQQDYLAFQQAVHKLHGLCCYTGVPKLQALCMEIEVALKENNHSLALARLADFNQECDVVLHKGQQLID